MVWPLTDVRETGEVGLGVRKLMNPGLNMQSLRFLREQPTGHTPATTGFGGLEFRQEVEAQGLGYQKASPGRKVRREPRSLGSPGAASPPGAFPLPGLRLSIIMS